ncbi:hypothetical protein MBLNU230_g6213t1 [Neophaeotheca triangularis]
MSLYGSQNMRLRANEPKILPEYHWAVKVSALQPTTRPRPPPQETTVAIRGTRLAATTAATREAQRLRLAGDSLGRPLRRRLLRSLSGYPSHELEGLYYAATDTGLPNRTVPMCRTVRVVRWESAPGSPIHVETD